MLIPALTIDQDGPGIDLTEQPEGYLLNVSDPVADFEYARNAVTLNCDLSGVEHVRLLFKAIEYGDEPHSPPSAPFGDDANFDGVVVGYSGGVKALASSDIPPLRPGCTNGPRDRRKREQESLQLGDWNRFPSINCWVEREFSRGSLGAHSAHI
jgi:hypothetical protein